MKHVCIWERLFSTVLVCFLTVTIVSVLLVSLAVGTRLVKADSNDYIQFSVFTLFSPLNRTYNSRFLTLNLTFGASPVIRYSLNYNIDGKYEGSIPFVINNPAETHVVYEATGFVKLPELSEGSHRLTVYFLSGLYNYHGVNPPGAPFTPTSPSSTDYVASWAGTVYFTIDLGVRTVDSTPPNISDLSIVNKTYTVNNVSLTFNVNELTSWIGYSLDGQANVTIIENTTLTGLSEGIHSLTVYAKDTVGNIGASETVNFTVAVEAEPPPEPQPSEPFSTWIVVAIVIVAVVGVAPLVYLSKVKKTTRKTEKLHEGVM